MLRLWVQFIDLLLLTPTVSQRVNSNLCEWRKTRTPPLCGLSISPSGDQQRLSPLIHLSVLFHFSLTTGETVGVCG